MRLGRLCRNPKERPTSAELLKHAWLADVIPRSMATPLTNISIDGPTILRVHTSVEHALPQHVVSHLRCEHSSQQHGPVSAVITPRSALTDAWHDQLCSSFSGNPFGRASTM